MTTTVRLDQGSAHVLHALSVFVSDEEFRPELCCIAIERIADRGGMQRFVVCATDGHVLGANVVHGTCDNFVAGKVRLLPLTPTRRRKPGTGVVIAAAREADGPLKGEELRLTWGGKWFTIEHEGFAVGAETVPDKFPSTWRTLIPNTASAPEQHSIALSAPYAGIWSEYAARAGFKHNPHTALSFRFSGSLKAVAVLNPRDPGFVGIWMPMHEDAVGEA